MEHIVLFQFKDGTSEEEIAALEREGNSNKTWTIVHSENCFVNFAVIRLREKIPVIVDIAFGANFTKRGKNFTHALVARLAKEVRDSLASKLVWVAIRNRCDAPYRTIWMFT